MPADAKSVDELAASDVEQYAVWAFVDDDSDELLLRPVKNTPVRDMAGKVVRTVVILANGARVQAMLGNIDLASSRVTQHFLTVSIERNGQWFHLARYHDADYSTRGPAELARFLALAVSEVFPIAYDIRAYVHGNSDVTSGIIPHEPLERLSRTELIALSVP